MRLREQNGHAVKYVEVLEVIIYHYVGSYIVLVAAKNYLLP